MQKRILLSFIFTLVILTNNNNDSLQARSDITPLLRAKRWNEIEQLLTKQKPRKKHEIYAAALALLKNKKHKKLSLSKQIHAFQYFTTLLGINCNHSKSELSLINCLSKIKNETQTTPIQRISSLRAATLAEKHKMSDLSQQFIMTANMDTKDLLSTLIFQQRLGQLIRSKEHKAAKLFSSRRDLQHITTPFSNFLRGRAFAYNKDKVRALHYYYKAAYVNKATWIHSNINKDIRSFYPELFKQTKANYTRSYRSLTALADKLTKKELMLIKHAYTFREIIQTSTKKTAYMDGIYFIRMNTYPSLQRLFQKYYKYIQKSSKILIKWGTALQKNNQNKKAFWLLRSFPKVFLADSDVWYMYIQLFDELYPNDVKKHRQQFKEIIKYLQNFPHHRRMQDLLLAKLLGTNDSEINWADGYYWKLATKYIPHHTASGRFFYWLKRYYIQNNQKQKLENLKNKFYALAPGSFYAAELWEKKKKGGYAKKWKNVKTRLAYLYWLSTYGGNKNAVHFLRNKKLSHLQNPKAKNIWQALQKTPSAPDSTTKLFFELGDWQTGVQYFKTQYREKLKKDSYLLQLTKLGHHSKNLNVQVYYLRRLLLSKGISLDPFSLPLGLGKLLYPRVYLKYVRQYSQSYQINENISYALMHQESLFRENAVSRSGARGLMQIMPRTGSWLSKKLFRRKQADIENPKTNIHLGIYYFARLIKKNQNDFRWAAIAYNGGPGNLRKWKKKYYTGDFYYFLERLPNNESRNYCRITYENFLRYKTIYTLN